MILEMCEWDVKPLPELVLKFLYFQATLVYFIFNQINWMHFHSDFAVVSAR